MEEIIRLIKELRAVSGGSDVVFLLLVYLLLERAIPMVYRKLHAKNGESITVYGQAKEAAMLLKSADDKQSEAMDKLGESIRDAQENLHRELIGRLKDIDTRCLSHLHKTGVNEGKLDAVIERLDRQDKE